MSTKENDVLQGLIAAASRLLGDAIDRGDVFATCDIEENDYPVDEDGDAWFHDYWELKQALDAAEDQQATAPDELVWACPDCHSSNVQCQMWVDPNTMEVFDDTEIYSWCFACEQHGTGEDFAGDGEKKHLTRIKRSETREAIEETKGGAA